MLPTRTLLLTALASTLTLINAQDMTLNIWTTSNCQGSATQAVLEDGDGSYCFEGLGGNSIGAATSNIENCVVTTWSGSNCEGSSGYFPAYDLGGCQNIPFASVELACG